MEKGKMFWSLLLLSSMNEALSLCYDHHCDHICSSGKYQCVNRNHTHNYGCHCYPADYCDDTDYTCSPLHCPHNELTRCNGHHKCECYCSLDSHCQNCPEQGFCVNGHCVCESNNYCSGGNQFYCHKNFHCAHNESKRCNSNDRCECFCAKDSECKNCPEKGFCVDGQCACESHDYCPRGNHLYCMYLDVICTKGFTAKCNLSNHCYCAYVPDTCSRHDVSRCFHLRCRPGEKKFCEGRTCTCKHLNYCKQNDADCRHMTCDSSLGEVNTCVNDACQCLEIPDFCGGSDTSTCKHLKCNHYQVKVCDNGMCKCQVNPSCDANLGLNQTCTTANTVLEVKDSNGTTNYVECTEDNHYPLCVDGRCQCIFWKTPPPMTMSISTTEKNVQCNTINDCNQRNTFMIFPTWQMPCPVAHIDCFRGKCFCSTERVTTTTIPMTTVTITTPTTKTTSTSTTTRPVSLETTTNYPTTIYAQCNTINDCNQRNTFMIFPTWRMPCPVDHIDCHRKICFCSLERVTTNTTPMTTVTITPATTKTTLMSTTTTVTTTKNLIKTTHGTPVATTLTTLATTAKPVWLHIPVRSCSLMTDCSGETCPLGTHPYCRYSQTSNSCQCTECTEHSHCSCSRGSRPHCSFDFLTQIYHCRCEALAIPDPTITGNIIGKK